MLQNPVPSRSSCRQTAVSTGSRLEAVESLASRFDKLKASGVTTAATTKPKPFDFAHDRPFDFAHDRPFDFAHDRPFDFAYGPTSFGVSDPRRTNEATPAMNSSPGDAMRAAFRHSPLYATNRALLPEVERT
jgi:hypothetical protein